LSSAVWQTWLNNSPQAEGYSQALRVCESLLWWETRPPFLRFLLNRLLSLPVTLLLVTALLYGFINAINHRARISWHGAYQQGIEEASLCLSYARQRMNPRPEQCRKPDQRVRDAAGNLLWRGFVDFRRQFRPAAQASGGATRP